jgi:hypothetical protein
MLLLEIISSSIIPALLLVLVLALTLHIIYLNKSFKHRIRLIVAIRMREAELARRLNKPLPSENKSIYNLDEKNLEVIEEELEIETVELYNDDTDFDIIR